MEKLCIPVALERNLALLDGSTEGGFSIDKALQFDQNEVSNLYSISGKELRFSFQEHGVAYNETSATDYMVKATVQLQSREDVPGFTLKVDLNPVEMWGINFTGRVIVKHASGEERMIYLPGTRTYDPAGLTGEFAYSFSRRKLRGFRATGLSIMIGLHVLRGACSVGLEVTG